MGWLQVVAIVLDDGSANRSLCHQHLSFSCKIYRRDFWNLLFCIYLVLAAVMTGTYVEPLIYNKP
jgi:uncharacterized membrane protein YhaH (DUF805 family)